MDNNENTTPEVEKTEGEMPAAESAAPAAAPEADAPAETPAM